MMEAASLAASCLLFFLLSTLSPLCANGDGSVGINYGRIANNLPAPAKVVELLKSSGITRVKLYDTDPTVLSAFAGSNISVVVALPNEHLAAAAASQSFTDAFVASNVSAHLPRTRIVAIAVGNEVFADSNNTTVHLVPAMRNVHASLAAKNLSDSVKISSPVALNALGSSYPPSNGSFKPDLVQTAVAPMLDFLRGSGSYLMLNAYPFFAYAANADKISLDYALFKPNSGVSDPGSGLQYQSLLDAQIDAVYAALSALRYDDLKIVVSETGWPSKGDADEAGASGANAASYNANLVKRVLTGGGTPLRRNVSLDVFLFALFNENQKPGPTSERNYGVFYPNEQKVYDVPFTLAALESGGGGGSGDLNNGSKVRVVAPPPGAPGQTWCVANEQASEEKLQAALDFACGDGGADCRPIQSGATCYDPNTLVAHASYAFNSYYQKNTRKAGTCDFGGAAHVVTQPPYYGECEYPTGY